MPSLGYLEWSPAPYTLGILVDGHFYRGGGLTPPHELNLDPGGSVLSTLGASDVVQFRWLGGSVPINTQPISTSFTVRFINEADLYAFEQAAMSGQPVDFWVDQPFAEIWSIPHKSAGQILWQTSRQLPYGLPGVTQTSRPPAVLIDGVVQTLAAGSPPASGEVFVPDEQGYSEIETPSDISGSKLVLRYSPIFRVRLSVRRRLGDWNDLTANVDVQETRQRRFT